MRHSSIFLALAIFIGIVASRPGQHKGGFAGVATFNDYSSQTSTVCGKMRPDNPSHFGAAASDISPQIAGPKCAGTIDMSMCQKGSPPSNYQGPSCPTSNCGLCYKVTNLGPYGTMNPDTDPAHAPATNKSMGSVIVQIIDSCPASHAANFCKVQIGIPANERCGDSETNQLDIDMSSYQALAGRPHGADTPNLDISIEPIAC